MAMVGNSQNGSTEHEKCKLSLHQHNHQFLEFIKLLWKLTLLLLILAQSGKVRCPSLAATKRVSPSKTLKEEYTKPESIESFSISERRTRAIIFCHHVH